MAGSVTIKVEAAVWAVESLANYAIDQRDKDAAKQALDMLGSLTTAGVGTCVNLVKSDLERLAAS